MKFPTIKSKKDSLYITLFFLFSIACIAGLRYEQRLEMQKGIAEKIIRFHVIANSDTKADQNLKLAVRDAVGIKMSGLLKDAADRAPVGGCDPEKYGGHEADGRESHCGERL